VLRAKYGYSGTLDGVPAEILDFLVSRSGGKPIYIEHLITILDRAEMLNFSFDVAGVADAGAEVINEVSIEALDALPTPHNIRGEVLQLFESLDPALQTALRLAAPMETFSEALLTDVGLPTKIVTRLAHLFNLAVDEGILDHYARAIPQDVLAADPSATHAWGWRMSILRREVLESMLHSEVQRVEHKIRKMRTFHASRPHRAPQHTRASFADATSAVRRSRVETSDVMDALLHFHSAKAFDASREPAGVARAADANGTSSACATGSSSAGVLAKAAARDDGAKNTSADRRRGCGLVPSAGLWSKWSRRRQNAEVLGRATKITKADAVGTTSSPPRV